MKLHSRRAYFVLLGYQLGQLKDWGWNPLQGHMYVCLEHKLEKLKQQVVGRTVKVSMSIFISLQLQLKLQLQLYHFYSCYLQHGRFKKGSLCACQLRDPMAHIIRERQAEAISPFLIQSQKSHSINFTVIYVLRPSGRLVDIQGEWKYNVS